MSEEKYDTVILGCCVELDFIYRTGNRQRIKVELVPDDKADFERGFLGISTPLAQTLLGEGPGYLIPYFTEEFQAIQIILIEKSSLGADHQSSARKKVIQETLEQIEFRDAVLFASSTSTKWGSYDADGLDYSKWKSTGEQNEDKVNHDPKSETK